MHRTLIVAFCAFSIFARAQSTPAGGNSAPAAPTTRPHAAGASARPMTPMERIAELEKRVAELERLVAQLTGTPTTQPTEQPGAKESMFTETPPPPAPTAPPAKPAAPPAPAQAKADPPLPLISKIHVGGTKDEVDKLLDGWKSESVAKYSDSKHRTYRYTNPKTNERVLVSVVRSTGKVDSYSGEQ